MATYTFRNTKSGKIEEHVMSISVYDQFKIDNPHLERYYDTAPTISFNGVGDNISKTDNTFKEVMTKIAEQNPRSPLADRFLRKDTKRVKTDAAIAKNGKRLKEKRESARKRG